MQGQSDEPKILTLFSCLTRLIRVVAYCRRPHVRLRNRKYRKSATASFLTTSKLSDARIAVLRSAQAKHFPLEIALLNTKGSLLQKNPLQRLNPFVGRVIEEHPGPDGLVGVATVKTATTTLRRHVTRLCPLSLPSSGAEGASPSDWNRLFFYVCLLFFHLGYSIVLRTKAGGVFGRMAPCDCVRFTRMSDRKSS